MGVLATILLAIAIIAVIVALSNVLPVIVTAIAIIALLGMGALVIAGIINTIK